MTRSLPNLWKQQFVVTDRQNSRVINSNNNQKLTDLKQKKNLHVHSTESTNEKKEEGFVEGLTGEKIQIQTQEDVMQEAVKQAELVLSESKRQGEQLLKDAESRAEQVRMRAMEIGNREGQQAAEEMLMQKEEKLNKEFSDKQAQMKAEYDQKFNEMETQLVDAIISVFDKVMHTDFERQREILLHLVTDTIYEIESGKELRLHINAEDADFLRSNMDKIQEQAGKNCSIEVLVDASIAPMGCTIETDHGLFHCGLDVQMKHLMEDIRALSC
ncbi:MAG: FliH/SctL family protein [Lachnospiraceae bacterium]